MDEQDQPLVRLPLGLWTKRQQTLDSGIHSFHNSALFRLYSTGFWLVLPEHRTQNLSQGAGEREAYTWLWGTPGTLGHPREA